MGKLEGAIPSPLPAIPDNLKNKIAVRATYKLTEKEAFLFHEALRSVDLQLTAEGADYSKLPMVFALFTRDGKFTILPDGDEVGTRINFIIYGVSVWRELKCTDIKLRTVFLEELCHHFWNIEDEEIVKYKVVELYNRYYSTELTINDLYRSDWKKGYPDLYPENA
ncbi:hypothetical protein [Bacillus sp. TH30]|uniref:hypothetical protein n=1 Tax=Bacillus sp. TH30 TaxID=2796395 RepID=UPI00191492BF|nr:hypothetical protein [Bacillus sp. TH30]MBK5424727.1 hypothetical protein [Bacillus sp. TH30]